MSHWAEIDDNNVVLRVLVGDNDDPNKDEGEQWLKDNLGGNWVKTSFNAAINGFRKNYAGISFTYDETLDAFIPPKCHDEAILNKKIAQWTCENEAHNVDLS